MSQSLSDVGSSPGEAPVVRGCCPLDCQDTCAWTATVVDGRAVKVTGAKDHPLTRGTLCAKVKDYEARTYARDRLLTPQIRVGPKGSGEFRTATWDEAAQVIAHRWRETIATYGGEALLPVHYLGSMGVVQRRSLQRVMHALGASRQVGSICGAAGNVLEAEGHPRGFDPEEIPAARFVIVWGSNPLATCHHHWRLLTDARKSGARIVVIDPRRTLSARAADEHIAVRPGTDWVLARGMANVMFGDHAVDADFANRIALDVDEYRDAVAHWTPAAVAAVTGVSAETVVRLAREFTAARPALIRGGVGGQQNAHGEVFVRSLSALAILGGHWRHPGGGLFIETNPVIDEAAAGRPDLQPRATRGLDLARLGETLLDDSLEPPVKALVVWNTNPAIVQPDASTVRKGLARDDLFTVVVEHFMTDTVLYADVVLPSTTQLEHFDILGAWGHQWITVNEPAVEPVGDARSHGAIMRELARHLALDHDAFTQSDVEIAASALPKHIDLDDLRAAGWMKSSPPRFAPSPAGPTLHLCQEEPRRSGDQGDGVLQLLTPKAQHFMNSSFANMERQRTAMGRPTLDLHPDDASRLSIGDGCPVRISATSGESVNAWAHVTDDIIPGVVALPGKWWVVGPGDGAATNSLTPAKWSPGGQPAYNDTYVTIVPLP